jgi:hypothetical protein
MIAVAGLNVWMDESWGSGLLRGIVVEQKSKIASKKCENV